MDSTRKEREMDERLLVPLRCLKEVPAGAPCFLGPERAVVIDGRHKNDRWEGVLLMLVEGKWRSTTAALRLAEMPAVDAWLDLSPPDPPGSRVDGLSVGLMLLGGEPGCRASIGVNPVRGRVYLDVHRGEWMTEYLVPDVREPLDGSVSSLRLAVAAVLRSRGSSTRPGEQEVDE